MNIIYPTIHKNEKSIWQIGLASHSTDGFKFSDQLRNYIWQSLVPNNLNYHIGGNDDWYYLQNNQGIWKIIFESNKISSDKICLQMALAGVTQKRMTDESGIKVLIKLNDRLIAEKNFENDRAAYRSSMKCGKEHFWEILIPKNLLTLGQNTISILTNGYVMYDAIKLCTKEGIEK